MKCCNCANLGKLKDEDGIPYDWCEKICDNPNIHMERKCKHYKAATNADRIRAMSDEELAECFLEWVACDYCPVILAKCKRKWANCKSAALDWLRQEATE